MKKIMIIITVMLVSALSLPSALGQLCFDTGCRNNADCTGNAIGPPFYDCVKHDVSCLIFFTRTVGECVQRAADQPPPPADSPPDRPPGFFEALPEFSTVGLGLAALGGLGGYAFYRKRKA
jgi:hypothetical protein